MCMKRLSSCHSGSFMILIGSLALRASILSIVDLESVHTVMFQEEGRIMLILVIASSSVL